jgi:hypothetical protein
VRKKKNLGLPDIVGFYDTFSKESDRAAGVLGAALLDLQLERLFRARLTTDTPPEVFAFRGPLGDFAARIDLAFALGWIDAEVRADLHIIRDIRNDFAHAADHELSFSDQSIAARTKNLKTAQHMRANVQEISELIPELEG